MPNGLSMYSWEGTKNLGITCGKSLDKCPMALVCILGKRNLCSIGCGIDYWWLFLRFKPNFGSYYDSS